MVDARYAEAPHPMYAIRGCGASVVRYSSCGWVNA